MRGGRPTRIASILQGPSWARLAGPSLQTCHRVLIPRTHRFDGARCRINKMREPLIANEFNRLSLVCEWCQIGMALPLATLGVTPGGWRSSTKRFYGTCLLG